MQREKREDVKRRIAAVCSRSATLATEAAMEAAALHRHGKEGSGATEREGQRGCDLREIDGDGDGRFEKETWVYEGAAWSSVGSGLDRAQPRRRGVGTTSLSLGDKADGC